MTDGKRKTVRLVLSDREWEQLRRRAEQEGRSLSNFLSRWVRAQLTSPSAKSGRKL